MWPNKIRVTLRAWFNDATIRRVLKNTALLFSAEMVGTVIGAIQFPLVTRMLGLENYGLWGLAISWVGLIGQIFGFRLLETIIKYLNKFIAEKDEPRALAILKLCVYLDLGVGLLISLGLLLSSDLAARYFLYRSYSGGADLIRLETFSNLMTITAGVWVAVLRVFDRFRQLSIFSAGAAVVQFVLWMLVLWLGGGLGGLILAAAVVRLGQTLFLAVAAQGALNQHFKSHWLKSDLRLLKGHWRSLWIMLIAFSLDMFRKIVNNNLDILLVGWFANPFQVGLYRLAEQLTGYINRIFGRFYETMYVEIPRLYLLEGPVKVRRFIRRMTFGLGSAITLLILGVYILSPILLPWVFGPDALAAIPIFFILVLSNYWVLLFWAPPLLMALDKAPQLVAISSILSALTLLALVGFTPLGYAYGAAFASVVNLMAGLIIYLAYFSRQPEFGWQMMFLNIQNKQNER